MRYLIVVLIVLVAIVAGDEEWKPTTDVETRRKNQEDCVKESGLTKAQMEKIRGAELPDEKEVHEFALCLGKKLGVFTDEGGYNADRVIAQLTATDHPIEKVRTGVEKCLNGNENNDTPAVRAYRGVVCMIRNNVEGISNRRK